MCAHLDILLTRRENRPHGRVLGSGQRNTKACCGHTRPVINVCYIRNSKYNPIVKRNTDVCTAVTAPEDCGLLLSVTLSYEVTVETRPAVLTTRTKTDLVLVLALLLCQLKRITYKLRTISNKHLDAQGQDGRTGREAAGGVRLPMFW